MIGRMKPILNVLSRDAHAVYRAHYCGICAATRQVYGRRTTLGHSSEMVFVSLLLDGLAPAACRTTWSTCTVLPLLPRRVAIGPRRHYRAIAAGVLAALQLDLHDAREDRERRLKQILCRPHFRLRGPIDPRRAWQEPFVQEAVAGLPKDAVGELVAGVIGAVFALAGLPPALVAAGCRIGHALGRLMNLSDAVEDYFADAKAGKPNPLRQTAAVPDPADASDRLHDILDELDGCVRGLPLRRNAELIGTLVNVHARARVETTIEGFREKLARVSHERRTQSCCVEEGRSETASYKEGRRSETASYEEGRCSETASYKEQHCLVANRGTV
jgi:hypothetical protein